MKKFTFTLFFAAFAAAAFAQATWTNDNSDNLILDPPTANLAIGDWEAMTNAKLFVNNALNKLQIGDHYGIYSTISGGNVMKVNKFSGYFDGGKFVVMNGNVGVGTTLPAYPLDVIGTMRTTTGLFSNVGIGTTTPQYLLDVNGTMKGTTGLFGNVGIGTTTPQATLDIASSSANSVRIGKVGYTGNLNVPLNAVAAQFNIDFTGYRDVNTEQIGARIAAVRFNNHQANSALVQKTGLAFYTNPTGLNAGTTDLYERMRIAPDGNVGIGTTNPTVKLDVVGIIRAEDVRVCLNQGCDFVFDKDYKLMPLQDLNSFISENKHLPEIAPAAVMESEGINLSEMNAKLLQKIEELTLYVIDLQKQIDELKK